MRRQPLRVVAIVAAATSALLLSGCVSWFQPPPVAESTSTPTGEQVSAELAPFYSQVLEWSPCGNGMQCTSAKAPLDWAGPAAASIDLALVRQPARGQNRIGSLLVNPGGPGASGYDFILGSVDYATSDRLQSSFDIVGFDPRGVGRSTPVSCHDDPAQLDEFLFTIPAGERGSDEWIASSEQAAASFGQRCLEHTGELLGHVDTVSAARDLDLLRAVLGDKKLNYLGYSYGTLLGATFAELYPERAGRLVLDGAIDPATSAFDVTAVQAEGFESALRAFLDDCRGQDDCPFSGSTDAAIRSIGALLDDLDASPLRGPDGRQLGSTAMFTAIILPLYNKNNWPLLRRLFTEVQKGQAEFAFMLADSYYGRNPDGTYPTNKTEAFTAINCLDYTDTADPAIMREQAAELEKRAPLFGPRMAYGGIGCSEWPFAPTRDRREITAPGSPDILVIGTTNDPATPYIWAKNLAAQLENGHLVTYKGEGHTAYNKSNSCVNSVVDDFLVDGTVPSKDPQC